MKSRLAGRPAETVGMILKGVIPLPGVGARGMPVKRNAGTTGSIRSERTVRSFTAAATCAGSTPPPPCDRPAPILRRRAKRARRGWVISAR
jgi:hypothetical protein